MSGSTGDITPEPQSGAEIEQTPQLQHVGESGKQDSEQEVASEIPSEIQPEEQDDEKEPEQDKELVQDKEPVHEPEEEKETVEESTQGSEDKQDKQESEAIQPLSDDDLEIDLPSSSSESSDDSDSDSDSDSESDDEVEKLSDNEEDKITGPIISKNEVVNEKAPELPEGYELGSKPIEELGEITGFVENSIVIKGKISAEFRVLKEGSILCVKDRPLGPLFEIFGNLKTPIYRIKFNDAETLDTFKDLKGETAYYVVPDSEFLLTDAIKQIKGSDASNFNDEEIPEEEQEFSDDEKEMAAKRKRKNKNDDKKKDKPKKPRVPNPSFGTQSQFTSYNAPQPSYNQPQPYTQPSYSQPQPYTQPYNQPPAQPYNQAYQAYQPYGAYSQYNQPYVQPQAYNQYNPLLMQQFNQNLQQQQQQQPQQPPPQQVQQPQQIQQPQHAQQEQLNNALANASPEQLKMLEQLLKNQLNK